MAVPKKEPLNPAVALSDDPCVRIVIANPAVFVTLDPFWLTENCRLFSNSKLIRARLVGRTIDSPVLGSKEEVVASILGLFVVSVSRTCFVILIPGALKSSFWDHAQPELIEINAKQRVIA